MGYCKDNMMRYDRLPEAMTEYLSNYGYHFSKKAYEFAASKMKKKAPGTGRMELVSPMSKEDVAGLLQRNAVTLENNTLYDAAYVATMAKADFWGSSIADEMHLAKYVKDKLDDPDQRPGYVFAQWYASMMFSGNPISWEDIM